jgi:hypothetical protein
MGNILVENICPSEKELIIDDIVKRLIHLKYNLSDNRFINLIRDIVSELNRKLYSVSYVELHVPLEMENVINVFIHYDNFDNFDLFIEQMKSVLKTMIHINTFVILQTIVNTEICI